MKQSHHPRQFAPGQDTFKTGVKYQRTTTVSASIISTTFCRKNGLLRRHDENNRSDRMVPSARNRAFRQYILCLLKICDHRKTIQYVNLDLREYLFRLDYAHSYESRGVTYKLSKIFSESKKKTSRGVITSDVYCRK